MTAGIPLDNRDCVDGDGRGRGQMIRESKNAMRSEKQQEQPRTSATCPFGYGCRGFGYAGLW